MFIIWYFSVFYTCPAIVASGLYSMQTFLVCMFVSQKILKSWGDSRGREQYRTVSFKNPLVRVMFVTVFFSLKLDTSIILSTMRDGEVIPVTLVLRFPSYEIYCVAQGTLRGWRMSGHLRGCLMISNNMMNIVDINLRNVFWMLQRP